MGIGFQTAARRAIKAERQRQISVEGWTAEHDDEHADGQMLTAAVLYYQNAKGTPLSMCADGCPWGWPWDAVWWKPKNKQRDLERAGALCLAERERLKRLGRTYGHVDQKLHLITNELARR